MLTYTLRLRNILTGDVLAYGDVAWGADPLDGTGATGVLLRDEDPLKRPVPQHHRIQAPWLHCTTASGRRRVMTYQTTLPAGEVGAVAFFHEGDYEIGFCRDPAFMVSAPMGLGDIEVRIHRPQAL